MNNVILIGRLTRDPELRYIPGTGTPVATFSIAIDREFSKEGKKETDFINIEVWNKAAENCANYTSKGSLVCIRGSIRVESWDKDGERRIATKVRAERVQFLDTKNKKEQNNQSQPNFEPSFEPSGLDPEGFTAIDDDDIPF